MSTRRWAPEVRSASLVACAALLASAHMPPAQATPRTAPLPMAAGGLSISAPSGPVSLGAGSAGSTFGTELGTVTVTAPTGTSEWTAWTALTSSFEVKQGDQSWHLPNNRVTYSVPGLTSILGALLTSCRYSGAQILEATREVAHCDAPLLSGDVAGSVSWNPRLTIRTEPTDPAGTYTGTITHSVV